MKKQQRVTRVIILPLFQECDTAPEHCIALHIFCALSVTVSEAERAFRKLKLAKQKQKLFVVHHVIVLTLHFCHVIH